MRFLAAVHFDVTQSATYTVGRRSSSASGVGADGNITANGSGTDLQNVSYGGGTATAPISVGACT